MLTVVRKYIKLLHVHLTYNLSKEMQNRGSFITQILFIIINNTTFFFQWKILFSLKKNYNQYSLNDILVLCALISLSYGIANLLFNNVYNIPELILTGKLDSYIIQPNNILFNVIISKSAPSAIGDIIYGYILIAITGVTFYRILIFSILGLLGALTFTSFLSIAGSLSFWFRYSDSILVNLNTAIICTAMYPEDIFHGVAKLFLFFVLPTGLMIYIPAKIISSFNMLLFLIVAIVSVFLFLTSFFIFKLGLKKYSSTNLMTPRI